MNTRLFIVQSEQDLERVYSVLKELRPHLSHEEHLSTYEQAQKCDNYEIAALEKETEIVAVMGYRIL